VLVAVRIVMPTFAVTGANGFIASHVVSKLVDSGYCVRATVRDAHDTDKTAHLRSLGDRVEIVTVKSLRDKDAVCKVFSGCDGIFHMASVHPEYGFKDTPGGTDELVDFAVNATTTVLEAAAEVGVKRVVLTSSLAAIECGNDDVDLREDMWSKEEAFNKKASDPTQWKTHFAYVKSKTRQEQAAWATAERLGLDMRVLVPGNLCIGPMLSSHINGTMTRIRDIMQGTNTLTGSADLGVVHASDVAEAHVAAMAKDSANGRYIISQDMVTLEVVFDTLRSLYPHMPVATMSNMDYSSGVPGKARKIHSRAEAELGLKLAGHERTLKDAVDSMIEKKVIPVA